MGTGGSDVMGIKTHTQHKHIPKHRELKETSFDGKEVRN